MRANHQIFEHLTLRVFLILHMYVYMWVCTCTSWCVHSLLRKLHHKFSTFSLFLMYQHHFLMINCKHLFCLNHCNSCTGFKMFAKMLVKGTYYWYIAVENWMHTALKIVSGHSVCMLRLKSHK